MSVSRATITRADGLATCHDCGGPVEPERVRSNGKPMSKCRGCQTAYSQRWREGTISMQLTPAEREVILRMRRGLPPLLVVADGQRHPSRRAARERAGKQAAAG